MTKPQNSKNRQAARAAGGRRLRCDRLHRRLVLEAIEDRVLLSAGLPLAPNPPLTAAPATAGQNAAPLSAPLSGSQAPAKLDIQRSPFSGYLDLSGSPAGSPGNNAAVACDAAGNFVAFARVPADWTGNSQVAAGSQPLAPAGEVGSGLIGATPALDYIEGPGGPPFLRIVLDPVGDQPEAPTGPPSHPTSAPSQQPVDGLLAGGFVDTTPRAGDPVHLTAVVSGPGAAAPSLDVPALPGGDGPPEAQLASPWRPIEGSRGREQTFDIAMIGQDAEPDRFSDSVANRVARSTETLSTFPEAAVHNAFAALSPAAISDPAGRTAGGVERATTGPYNSSDPPGQRWAVDGAEAAPDGGARAIGSPAPTAELAPIPAAAVGVASTLDVGEWPTGVYARFVAAPPPMPVGRAAAANATPEAGNAAGSTTAATGAPEALSHTVLLDSNWTKNTVGFLAVAIVSRQLMEAASPQVAARGTISLDERDNRLTKLPV